MWTSNAFEPSGSPAAAQIWSAKTAAALKQVVQPVSVNFGQQYMPAIAGTDIQCLAMLKAKTELPQQDLMCLRTFWHRSAASGKQSSSNASSNNRSRLQADLLQLGKSIATAAGAVGLSALLSFATFNQPVHAITNEQLVFLEVRP